MVRSRKTTEEVPLSEFKARCSEFIDRVARDGREVIITRHGHAVARLVSEAEGRRSPLGTWKGLIKITGDIVHNDWSDEFEAASD